MTTEREKARAAVCEAARKFQPILKTMRWWEWTPQQLGDLSDYDSELPDILRRASKQLYDAVEELKYQEAMQRGREGER